MSDTIILTVQIVLAVDEHGQKKVGISGPMGDQLILLGVLARAMDIVSNYQPEDKKLVLAPPPGVVDILAKQANSGHVSR